MRPSYTAAVCVLACALLAGASATRLAGKRGLLQDRIGVKYTGGVEAPDATRWSAGVVTAARGPATYSVTGQVVGPNPPSFAAGVNPAGGYAEVNTQTVIDATLPRYHMDARASLANTGMVEASIGGKILPEATGQIDIHPTVPITMPVFRAGGKILPEPQGQLVINPRNPPAAKDGSKRRLLNWGASETIEAQAPSTPRVQVAVTPTPAVIASSLNIRSETPNVVVNANVPGAVIDASGQTTVDIAKQKKFVPPAGKGAWTTVNLSRQPDKFTTGSQGAINWPTSSVVASSNNPLSVSVAEEATLPNPTRDVAVTVTPSGLGTPPDGYVRRTTNLNIPIGK